MTAAPRALVCLPTYDEAENIGPITAARHGITTVDVGVPILSMHSARELCGADDPFLLAGALKAFLEG